MSAYCDKLCAAVLEQRPMGRMNLTPIRLPDDPGKDIHILRAWLGADPNSPLFGRIQVVFVHKNRVFQLDFHVWAPNQAACMANRVVTMGEFVIEDYNGVDMLNLCETGFGARAAWLYTSDAALDEDSLTVRAVIKACKQFSVSHQLCKKFRTAWPKQKIIEI